MIRSSRILALLAAAACRASDATAPLAPAHPAATDAIALGAGFSCALTDDGRAYCWGLNANGQLGDGLTTTYGAPVAALTTLRFMAIASSATGTCALVPDGSVRCWGSLPAGIRGDSGSWTTTPVAVPGSTRLTTISVGLRFACGLDAAGHAYCWGSNSRGQLGTGTTDSAAVPTAVAGGLTFASVSAGFWHACGVTTAGAAYCWGDNLFGEVGSGDPANRISSPEPVAGAIVFRSVDAGTLTACGVATDGTGYCWGENRVGELGDGTTTSSTVPVRVAGGLTFDRIRPARGNSTVLHTCGATSGGTLYCWGLNDKGQVGATTAATCTFSVTPVPCALSPSAVSGLGAVAAFDVGTSHSCALTTGAAVMCWGDNTQAELGDGTNVNHPTPVAVVGGLHFP